MGFEGWEVVLKVLDFVGTIVVVVLFIRYITARDKLAKQTEGDHLAAQKELVHSLEVAAKAQGEATAVQRQSADVIRAASKIIERALEKDSRVEMNLEEIRRNQEIFKAARGMGDLPD